MQTTLNKIKSHSPCVDGWNKLLSNLNKNEADDEPLKLLTILKSNGVFDTIWAFQAVEGNDKEIRLFAADCAELVLPIFEKQYPNDDSPRKAIEAARHYANGLISKEELADAAWFAYAAYDAECAARDAAMDARDAARSAASAASAAKAAWSAARSAARVAWDAESAEIKSILLKYI